LDLLTRRLTNSPFPPQWPIFDFQKRLSGSIFVRYGLSGLSFTSGFLGVLRLLSLNTGFFAGLDRFYSLYFAGYSSSFSDPAPCFPFSSPATCQTLELKCSVRPDYLNAASFSLLLDLFIDARILCFSLELSPFLKLLAPSRPALCEFLKNLRCL